MMFAPPESPREARTAMAAGAGVFLLIAAGLGAAILVATRGVFSFTLDDPYIHLAMAEEIGRGGYGVNPGEPASASSSALYPYLLAALLKLGVGQFSALGLNLLAGALSAGLLLRLAQAGGLVGLRASWLTLAGLAAVLTLALNLAGLAFSGMEHGLHVALGLAALLGLARLSGEGKAPGWLVPVLALAPLIRFEGLAILVGGSAALIVAGRWREALAAMGLGGAGLALFAFSLRARGLPWLPSSVLAKVGDGAHGIGAQLLENLHAPGAPLVIAGAVLPLMAQVAAGRMRRPAPAAVFVALALSAQMVVGAFGVRYHGWLHRYEAWAVALAAGALLLAFGDGVRRLLGTAPRVRGAILAALVILALLPYVRTTLSAPLDARSIRLQQREMHRFAAEVLKAPVAVNDLGWVSFENDYRVLDLWGLASEPARLARQGHAPPGWMDELARRGGVRAAMVYDDWIGPAPARWTRLGALRARVPLTVGPRVTFYAIDPADAPAVRRAVAQWAKGLPAEDLFAPDGT